MGNINSAQATQHCLFYIHINIIHLSMPPVSSQLKYACVSMLLTIRLSCPHSQYRCSLWYKFKEEEYRIKWYGDARILKKWSAFQIYCKQPWINLCINVCRAYRSYNTLMLLTVTQTIFCYTAFPFWFCFTEFQLIRHELTLLSIYTTQN